ncbi:hypothetical protein N2152v2_004291 [Parachlorella kessleri]
MVASPWLRELSSLRRLESLVLGFLELTNAATAGAAVRFPSLPSLAHLRVHAWSGPPELHVQLDDLPALIELELYDGGRAALQASRPALQLQKLTCTAECLAVDFAALPCLKYGTFSLLCQLEDPATIAVATALTYLELDGRAEWGPSPLEVLRSLPPSVRCVSMDEQWPQEAADLLGDMTSLVGLQLHHLDVAPLPADDAPVWAGLRAFGSSSLTRNDEGGEVPKALRQSSKLEVLQVSLMHPTIQDIDVITSLPALRKLFVQGCRARDPDGRSLLNMARRAAPQVEVVLDADDSYGEEFFKLRCAL